MGSSKPTIVGGHHDLIDATGFRVEALSMDALVELVNGFDDPSSLTVALDAAVSKDGAVSTDGAIDHDALVALVAVLVALGVQRFETRHQQVVRRILDTHAAISAGEIEVLEPGRPEEPGA